MHPDARGFRTARFEEVGRKADLLAALAREQGLSAVLLTTQHNFSWLSAGGSNRIDALRENGVATLMVTADRRRYLLANTIESARISKESLDGLDFAVLDFPWEDERQDPALLYRIAVEAAGSAGLGADLPSTHARLLEPAISSLRQALDEGELPRYRSLCQDAATVVGSVVRTLEPGLTEHDIAQRVGMCAAQCKPAPLQCCSSAPMIESRPSATRHPPTACGRTGC